jgi:hypothetical protein
MFEPTRVAARWYFGELMHEDLPAIAIEALEHGYDGPMLRRLAGLTRPTSRDIRVEEIDGAFREMGIAAPLPMRQAQLRSLLRRHGPSPLAFKTRSTLPLISELGFVDSRRSLPSLRESYVHQRRPNMHPVSYGRSWNGIFVTRCPIFSFRASSRPLLLDS